MKRIALALVMSAIATSSVLASSASASGPAAPGKETIEIQCEGYGPLTVSTPKPESSKGAGQVVGRKLHGIPVSFTFVVADLTKGTTLENETERRNGGKAHERKPTTECSATFAEVPASVFFGEEHLPPGVAGSDIIRASFTAKVIIKA